MFHCTHGLVQGAQVPHEGCILRCQSKIKRLLLKLTKGSPGSICTSPETQSSCAGVQNAQYIYQQQLSVPEVVLERSVSSWGDTSRMRALFHKLRSGDPLPPGQKQCDPSTCPDEAQLITEHM